MLVTLDYLNYGIDYEAEIYYLNLLANQSQIVSSDLLELVSPEEREFVVVYKQELSKLKAKPVFFHDISMENLLMYARSNNIYIFKNLMNKSDCPFVDLIYREFRCC